MGKWNYIRVQNIDAELHANAIDVAKEVYGIPLNNLVSQLLTEKVNEKLPRLIEIQKLKKELNELRK